MSQRILLVLTLGAATSSAAGQSGEYWTGPLNIQFAVVRSAGNEADIPDGYGKRWGRVDYDYSVSSHEVTNAEYAAFLNSVSADGDPYELWHPADGRRWHDEIVRFDNGQGGYRYEVASGKEDNPVVRVTHRSIFRMMNWLHNGMQHDLSSTDYGAYDTSQWGFDQNGHFLDPMEHESGARYWLSTEDEWYKAAYFDPNRYGTGSPGYWTFPTTHDGKPDIWYELGANPANSAIYRTAFSESVGSVPATLSPWGVWDMAGNAREYMASWNTEGLPSGIAYVTRGDYFIGDGTFADKKGSRGAAFAYFGGNADWDLHSFRIVTRAIPAPGSLTALLTFTLVCPTYRRRGPR